MTTKAGAAGAGVSASGGRGGEFDLIRRFFDRGPARDALLGVGDDCALLAPKDPHSALAVSTDLLLAGRHFAAGIDPAAIGHKSLAVNLSDLAAMGAQPRAFTLAIALPEFDEVWLTGFCAGLFALADRHHCELIGGDTTRGPLAVCITIFGEVPPSSALRRDGAQPGDDLWVSGALGAAARAVRARNGQLSGAPLSGEAAAGAAPTVPIDARGPASPPASTPTPASTPAPAPAPAPASTPGWLVPALARLDYPQPRVELGLALRHLVRSAIDLSDGLLGDLAHVVERSRVGAELDWPLIPVDSCLDGLPEEDRRALALSGGDDYELLFSAAPENRTAIAATGARLALPLTRIGRIVDGSTIRVLDARARPLAVRAGGFDHFAG